jgi:hypothetical protein
MNMAGGKSRVHNRIGPLNDQGVAAGDLEKRLSQLEARQKEWKMPSSSPHLEKVERALLKNRK